MFKTEDFDVFSFDIFDTLITRKCLRPKDLLLLLDKFALSLGLIDFKVNRELAEDGLYKENPYYNFDDIYNKLSINYNNKEKLDLIKKKELELEYNLSIPCESMIDFLNYVKNDLKKCVILVSDMYLSSNFIESLLAKHNIKYDFLLVSNEVRRSKVERNIWETVKTKVNGNRIIHIGDDRLADEISPQTSGIHSFLYASPYIRFRNSDLYKFLHYFHNQNPFNSLLLGLLANQALNSSKSDKQDILKLWMGPVFFAFDQFLRDHCKGKKLLFITRESHVLEKVHKTIERVKNQEKSNYCVFYGSRVASTLASLKDEESLASLADDPFEGTISDFFIKKIGFLPKNLGCSRNKKIVLPIDKEIILNYLKSSKTEIFNYSSFQRDCIKRYLQDELGVTSLNDCCLVDIGYSGRSQLNYIKAFGEQLSGLYLFFDPYTLKGKLNGLVNYLCDINTGNHPIYQNLFFLEASMKAPFGSFLRFDQIDNSLIKRFDDDTKVAISTLEGQDRFIKFCEEFAYLEKTINSRFDIDFALIESIWIIFLEFNLLPNGYLNSLSISDPFSNLSELRYSNLMKAWSNNQNQNYPLRFNLPLQSVPIKEQLKFIVKKFSPRSIYPLARFIWTKFIK